MGKEGNVLLKVEHLKKYFPVKEKLSRRLVGYVKAVDDVSFEIREGETLALVGESGCGKSTTGYTILQLEKASEGQIYFDGKDLMKLDKVEMKQMRRQIQMVFQDSHSSLNPHMLVRDIIEEPLQIYRIPRAERKERVACLLEMTGLTQEQGGRYPHEFSGGQRQRVGIARALALTPRLIIADEPVSALDVSVQAQIINLLLELQRELKLSYLFITHDLSVAKYISDRIAVMYLGEIIEIGEKEELFQNPLHPYTRALLQAVPVPDPGAVQGNAGETGDIPSPLNPPSGCRYHTRCPNATERCALEAPTTVIAGTDHQVRCHLYKGTDDQSKEKEAI